MTSSKVPKILRQAFDRKKRKNNQYSLAWLARDLKVSRVFIARIFSGEKEIPLDRLDQVTEALEMDEISQETLLNAVVGDSLAALASQSALLKKHLSRQKKVSSLPVFEKYQEVPANKFDPLSPWFNTAILDMVSLKDFRFDFDWMADRLGLPLTVIKRSWFYLQENGFLEETPEGWRKSAEHLRFPTKSSQQIVRDYHEALITKGLSTMKTKHSERDFERRLITGVTLTANAAELAKTKIYLQTAQYEAAEMLRAGECDEIYHLAVMLYPLTR